MPTSPSFTPVKLELTEQIELGYLPLRDDFDRVNNCFVLVTIKFISCPFRNMIMMLSHPLQAWPSPRMTSWRQVRTDSGGDHYIEMFPHPASSPVDTVGHV